MDRTLPIWGFSLCLWFLVIGCRSPDPSIPVSDVSEPVVVDETSSGSAGDGTATRGVKAPPQDLVLDLDISVRPDSESEWETVELPRGTIRSGDHLRVRFRPSVESYIYIIGHDSGEWGGRFFPNRWLTARTNPVSAGDWVELSRISTPEFTGQVVVDDVVGEETLYIFVDSVAHPDIERSLSALGEERFQSAEANHLTLALARTRGAKGFKIDIEETPKEESTHHRLSSKLGAGLIKFTVRLSHEKSRSAPEPE